MTDRPKMPPGFRDATGATFAVIGIGPPREPENTDFSCSGGKADPEAM